MKRLVLAALAATSLLAGGGVASAAPTHGGFGGFGGHGPVVTHGPVFGGGFRGGPVFRGPVRGGFGYQRFGYGALLPAAFLAPERFVLDYAAYELAPPPANFEWVQNGPDALLVNLSTGMVVQVVPNAIA
jgi:Ni/Co efflux regulator RcnB